MHSQGRDHIRNRPRDARPGPSRERRSRRRQSRALETRRRLLQAAMERFWTQGYGATSVSQILSDAEANAGSLYNEFGGKEGLILAVLDRFQELLDPLVFNPAACRTPDPLERVALVFMGYRCQLEETDFRFGSPVGNLAGEVSHTHPELRGRLAELHRAWRKGLERLLLDASPPPAPGTNVEALSAYVLSVLEGAVLQARAAHSLEPFDDALTLLLRSLRDLIQARNQPEE